MKKVLTVLAIMAIAMGMVFAVDPGKGKISNSSSESGTLTTEGYSAELNVKFKATENMAKFFEIGFSNAEVKKTDDGDIPTVEAADTLELTAPDTIGADASGNIYVYWIVKGINANVSMKAGGDMTTITDSTTIKWQASVEDDKVTSSGDSAQTIQVNSSEISADSGIVVDSQQITVSTVDIANTAIAANSEYSSTLTLTIASV